MRPPKVLSAQEALSQISDLGHRRVLLINPPVIESRYAWIRWNQPLDLLKLGNLIVQEYGCEVKLFDFMLPSPAGNVPRRQWKLLDAPANEPLHWLFGKPWPEFDAYLDTLAAQSWLPDSVWITTLTSFWWQTVPMVADRVKNKLKRTPIFLYGNYPSLETTHATRFCPNIDVVVQDHAELSSQQADFSLYGEQKLAFCALDVRSPTASLLTEIEKVLKRGTNHFCFFDDNLFVNFDSCLKPLLEHVIKQNWDLRFHGICGIETKDFPLEHAQLLRDAHFSELHFEPALNQDGTIDEPLYCAAMQACEQAGFVAPRGAGWESRSHYLSGFFWVGCPDDDLDILVWNALKVLQLIGMVIPKPYSPLPGSEEYRLLSTSRKGGIEPQDISPHRMPFAGLNGIERSDYADLYRMTAFLNMKVRDHTFDFLGDTYLAKVIRESLAGRRWDI